MATRYQLVEKAQEKILEAIDLLEIACEDDENAKAYIVDHLKNISGAKHGFCDNSLNLDELLERYEGENKDVGGDDLLEYDE